MLYKNRVWQVYTTYLAIVTIWVPTPLQRFRFVRSWIVKLAMHLTIRVMDETALTAKEAFDAGWASAEQTQASLSKGNRPGVFVQDHESRLYAKNSGWVQ